MRKSWNIIFYLILALGVVGLVSLLVFNPMSVFKSILSIVVIAAIIYGVYRLFINKSSNDYTKYRRAVKQTKKKTKERTPTPTRPSHLQLIQSQSERKQQLATKINKRAHSHLTVIDGKKRRKKSYFSISKRG